MPTQQYHNLVAVHITKDTIDFCLHSSANTTTELGILSISHPQYIIAAAFFSHGVETRAEIIDHVVYLRTTEAMHRLIKNTQL